MGRSQASPTLAAHAGTEAEEPVRVSKKHLQRSTKLVAAKEQLPEEEERRYHRTYQGSPASAGWSHVCDSSQKKRPLHNSRSRRRRSNPSGKLCSRRKRPWRRHGRNMLRRKRHVRAWSRKSKKRKTKSVCTTRTRTREEFLIRNGTTRLLIFHSRRRYRRCARRFHRSQALLHFW